MSNRTISQMPQVSSDDVKPLYTGDEAIEKLARAVNGMRELGKDPRTRMSGTQQFDLELMYSIAVALRDKK